MQAQHYLTKTSPLSEQMNSENKQLSGMAKHVEINTRQKSGSGEKQIRFGRSLERERHLQWNT